MRPKPQTATRGCDLGHGCGLCGCAIQPGPPHIGLRRVGVGGGQVEPVAELKTVAEPVTTSNEDATPVPTAGEPALWTAHGQRGRQIPAEIASRDDRSEIAGESS